MQTNSVSEHSLIHSTMPQWGKFAQYATRRHFKPGENVFMAGDVVKCLHYIVSGEINFIFTHLDGREKVLHHTGPQSTVGEIFFFLNIPCTGNFVCFKETTTLCFSRDTIIRSLLPNNPDLLNDLLYSLAYKYYFTGSQLLAHSLDSTAVRICRILSLHLEHDDQGRLVARTPWRLSRLEDFLGTHRVTVYKAIKGLESKGVLRKLNNMEVLILDEDYFREIAASAVLGSL